MFQISWLIFFKFIWCWGNWNIFTKKKNIRCVEGGQKKKTRKIPKTALEFQLHYQCNKFKFNTFIILMTRMVFREREKNTISSTIIWIIFHELLFRETFTFFSSPNLFFLQALFSLNYNDDLMLFSSSLRLRQSFQHLSLFIRYARRGDEARKKIMQIYKYMYDKYLMWAKAMLKKIHGIHRKMRGMSLQQKLKQKRWEQYAKINNHHNSNMIKSFKYAHRRTIYESIVGLKKNSFPLTVVLFPLGHISIICL